MRSTFFASSALVIGLFSYDLFQYSARPNHSPSCSPSPFSFQKEEERILCYEKRVLGIYQRTEALAQKIPTLNAMLIRSGEIGTLCELNFGLKDLQTDLHSTLEMLAKRAMISQDASPLWKMGKWTEYRQKAEDFHEAVLKSKVPKPCAKYIRRS